MTTLSYHLNAIQSSEYYVINASYNNGVLLTNNTGLTLINSLNNDILGINVYVYKDIYNHIFIGVEGTNLNSNGSYVYGSLNNDSNIVLFNNVTEVAYDTINEFIKPFIENYGNNNVYISGHSMGGTLAEELASNNNTGGMSVAGTAIPTFNSANSNYKNFDSYVGYGDPVAGWNGILGNYNHYGNTYYVGDSSNVKNSSLINYISNSLHYHSLIDNYNNYISPLLPSNDKLNYIADNTKKILNESMKNLLKSASVSIDPIIIYKDRPAIISSDMSLVHYDLNISGISEQTSWIGKGDNTAFLVKLDIAGKPILLTHDDFISMGINGEIDSNNNNWDNLYLWYDDGNTKLDSGELVKLSDSQILSLSTNLKDESIEENGSTLVSSSSVTMKDGSTETVGDMDFQVDPTYTITDKDQNLSDGTLSHVVSVTNLDRSLSNIDLSSLPNLHGYGVLSSLEASIITINADGSETLNNTLYQDVVNLKNINSIPA